MSIEIDWQKLISGPEGLKLAESIRSFIHDRFQQVALPRFIRSVQVHSFEFGDQAPRVTLKDICDPLPDFYEDDDEEDDEDDADDGEEKEGSKEKVAVDIAGSEAKDSLQHRREAAKQLPNLTAIQRPQLSRLQSSIGIVDHLSNPLLSRASTPGIPGGTSNLGYFNLPLSARLQGTQTPLAAVAGGGTPLHSHHPSLLGGPFQPTWQTRTQYLTSMSPDGEYDDPSTRPTTAHSTAHSHLSGTRSESTQQQPEIAATDTQIVLHVAYDGNIKMSLTAEILLDYPMTSFVGIPLKLNVTGISFDGVALLAYLKRKAHFCFLGPEDAEILVGAENKVDTEPTAGETGTHEKTAGGGTRVKIGDLLKEIRVETEIGQKEGGKQVLKNVSKVEKFVLEQVQRIFEDEFVYPSFWTFLV